MLVREVALLTLLAVPSAVTAQWVGDTFARARIADAAVSPDGKWIIYTRVDADTAADRYRSQLLLIPADSGASREIGLGSRVSWSPDGRMIAHWSDDSGTAVLLVRDSVDAPPRELARFREVSPVRWSPNGMKLAVAGELATAGEQPRIGSLTERAELLTIDVRSGQRQSLREPDFLLGVDAPGLPGLAEFDWLDDATLIVAGRERTGMRADASSLYLIELTSGARRYFAGEGGRWHRPVVSPDRNSIAFVGYPLSDRYVAEELIVLERNGTGLKRMTVGLDRDVADVAWAPDSRTLWFAAEDRGSRNLHRIRVRDGKSDPGTTGNHMLSLEAVALRGNFGVAIRETAGDPGVLVRFQLDRPWQMRQLVVPDVGLPSGQLDEFEFRASTGTIVSGFLRAPPDFNPAVRHPLIVELHGGPSAMSGYGYTPQAVAYANAGWLVMRVNHGGSLGYGTDLANTVGHEWPGRELADIREAIADVVARGFVDASRIMLVSEGGGAVSAAALGLAAPTTFSAVVMRCGDGGYLTGGGSGYDAPFWGSWRYARPYPGKLALWLGRSPLHDAATWRLPLMVQGGATEFEPFPFAASFAVAGARGGAKVVSHQVAVECTAVGPVTARERYKTERAWLERHTRPGPP